MLALSVSTSAMISPIATRSPGRLSHFRILPSSIVSESFGMVTSIGIAGNQGTTWPALVQQQRGGGRTRVLPGAPRDEREDPRPADRDVRPRPRSPDPHRRLHFARMQRAGLR